VSATQHIDCKTLTHIAEIFHLASWPVTSEAAAEEQAKMLTTHCVNALPAYDVNGNILEPETYKKNLPGAQVRVTFSMRHWIIKKKNVFTANVESLRVLVDAEKEEEMVANKRKLAKIDPDKTVAKKKLRAT
jgi:hypothetical protein